MTELSPNSTIELQSCTLEFFEKEQHNEKSWLQSGGWSVLNVETHKDYSRLTGPLVFKVWLWRRRSWQKGSGVDG